MLPLILPCPAMNVNAMNIHSPVWLIPSALPFFYIFASRQLNEISFLISTATPDAGEDPKVTRAKFFIRDLFLVSSSVGLVLSALQLITLLSEVC